MSISRWSTHSNFYKYGAWSFILAGALLLTGCSPKNQAPALSDSGEDRAAASLTEVARSQVSRQPIADLMISITETGSVTNRSLVRSSARTNDLGRAILTLPIGRYIVQPLANDQYLGGQTVDLSQTTQIELTLTPRQVTNNNSTD